MRPCDSAHRILIQKSNNRNQVSIISTAITQSALLNHEVYLIEYAHPSLCEFGETDWISRIDNSTRERMRHLRCLCFVRPSPDTIQLLIDEIRDPKYGEYVICKKKVSKHYGKGRS